MAKADTFKMKTYIIAGACGLTLLVSLIAAGLAFNARFDSTNLKNSRQHAINVAVCDAVKNIDLQITATLHRSLINLPKIAYYKQHPAELHAQVADVKASIVSFRPPDACATATVNAGGK